MENQEATKEAGKARYTHDCEKCKSLGEFHQYDLYFCTQTGNWPTVIARFGDDGPDYISGISFAATHPHIAEAKRRAIDAGYLQESTGRNDTQLPSVEELSINTTR